MIHEAIHNLYTNVKQVIIEEDGTITALDINGNEVTDIDMEAVNLKATELQAEAVAKEQAKEDLKASAKQKLINGEALTEDEANVMVGL